MWRLFRGAACVAIWLAPQFVASAQEVTGAHFLPIPSPGGTCSFSRPDAMSMRLGMRGMIDLQIAGKLHHVSVGVDSLLRPVMIADMRRPIGILRFDSSAFDRQALEFSVEERARAKALALDVVGRCPNVPVVRNAQIDPAPHTAVLQAIAGLQQTCHGPAVDSASARPRVGTSYSMSMTAPVRVLKVVVDAKAPDRLLYFYAAVTWGAERAQETETASLRLTDDGRVLKATKTLGYGSRAQHDTTLGLRQDEIVQARALAREVIAKCK